MAGGARIKLHPVSLMASTVEPLVLPLGNGERADLGIATVTLDPRTDRARSGGWFDVATGEYEIAAAVQLSAPGLVDLARDRGFDPQAVGPLRIVYTLAGRVDDAGDFTSSGKGSVDADSLWAGIELREDCTRCCLTEDVRSARQGESAETAILKGDDIVCRCTCPFAVEFPERLGGGSTSVSIRTVFVARPDRGALGYKGKMLGLLSRLCKCEEASAA
jgi:hypothetical protein